jgi:hypothetical protein
MLIDDDNDIVIDVDVLIRLEIQLLSRLKEIKYYKTSDRPVDCRQNRVSTNTDDID